MGFGMRNGNNWHDILVEAAAEYGMELFYPPDNTYGMLKGQAPQVGKTS